MKALVKSKPERGIWMQDIDVPKGEARIRTQMTAGLNTDQLDQAVEAFTEVGLELGVISP